MKPAIIFLVGVPGVGKTTFCEAKQEEIVNTYNITDRIASDDIIDDIAQSLEKTYTEVFQESIEVANKYAEAMVGVLSASKRSFIIDRTNLTVKSRKRMLDLLKNSAEYEKVAVVFEEPNAIELRRRLDVRAKEEGKIISNELLKEMQDRFEKPTLSEGFDDVYTVKEFEDTFLTDVYGEAVFG